MANTGRTLYLDYNASAPLLPEAREAMFDALAVDGNPSSVHAGGRSAKALIQRGRRSVAALVGAKPDHVVFTSGATEAASTLLTPHYSFGRSPLTFSALYVCAADHPCTLAGGQFEPERIAHIPVDDTGLIDLAALEAHLEFHDNSSGLPLVAVHWANNETGVIQPIKDVAQIVKTYGGVLIVDAVQALSRITVDITDSCGDFLIVSSHKIGGPKGAGAYIAFSDLLMPMPRVKGGGQERGHRAGTEAVANIAGFGAAADQAVAGLDRFAALAELRDEIERRIIQIAPNAIIHGRTAPRLANTVFFTIPWMKAETAQIAFDLAGIAVSSGSACSSGKVGRSHVLSAMGDDRDEGAIRVSFGPQTDKEAVAAFGDRLAKIVERTGPEIRVEKA